MGDGWKVRLVSGVGRLWVGGRGRVGGGRGRGYEEDEKGKSNFFFYI